jgi:hypothetical protein
VVQSVHSVGYFYYVKLYIVSPAPSVIILITVYTISAFNGTSYFMTTFSENINLSNFYMLLRYILTNLNVNQMRSIRHAHILCVLNKLILLYWPDDDAYGGSKHVA